VLALGVCIGGSHKDLKNAEALLCNITLLSTETYRHPYYRMVIYNSYRFKPEF
jgi:hypothetical protein